MRPLCLQRSLTAAVALAAAALATRTHAGHGDIAGLGDGILHVTSGNVFMLGAVAVGIWAMAFPWKRAWILSVVFVAAMAAGAWAGLGRPREEGVEIVVVASLVVMGALLMRANAFSLPGAVAICLVFGALHGYAHGTEAGTSGDFRAHVGGLAIATAALAIAGMALGLMLRLSSRYGLRIAGALVALAGLWFAAGLAR